MQGKRRGGKKSKWRIRKGKEGKRRHKGSEGIGNGEWGEGGKTGVGNRGHWGTCPQNSKKSAFIT